MDQVTEEGYDRAYRRGLIIWAALVLLAAATMAVSGMLAEITPYGMDYGPYLYASLPAGLAFLSPVVTTFFKTTTKGCLVAVLQIVITLAAGYASLQVLHELEFRRTPPCWGIHSSDPGSGADCPEGMREDFTHEQLVDYYRKDR